LGARKAAVRELLIAASNAGTEKYKTSLKNAPRSQFLLRDAGYTPVIVPDAAQNTTREPVTGAQDLVN
jgi:hypothetical protein